MVLHKIVNGRKIDLTPKEEAAILQEWEENRVKAEKEKDIYEKKEQLKKQAKQKIYQSAGLTKEEIGALDD